MTYRMYFFLAILIVVTFQVEAGVIKFKNNKIGFDTAVAGLSGVSTHVLNFESQAVGTVVPGGAALEGITFDDNLPSPFEMAVGAEGSISDPNALAILDTSVPFDPASPDAGFGEFGLNDVIDVGFEASNAFGFFLIVGDGFEFFDNDVNVDFGGETISVLASDTATTIVSGDLGFAALWIGFVDDVATHTTAIIRFGSPDDEFSGIGELDNITTTRADPTGVAEPTIILLIGIGLLSLFGFARRRY
jgi:hypothetical protein